MVLFAQTIKAQNGTSCNDAILLDNCNSNIAISNYETWLNFTASDSVYQLTFPAPTDTPRAHIVSIEIYQGICGTMSLKQTFSSGHNISVNDTFLISNLTINQNYFIKLIKGVAPPTCRICTMVDTSYFGACIFSVLGLDWELKVTSTTGIIESCMDDLHLGPPDLLPTYCGIITICKDDELSFSHGAWNGIILSNTSSYNSFSQYYLPGSSCGVITEYYPNINSYTCTYNNTGLYPACLNIYLVDNNTNLPYLYKGACFDIEVLENNPQMNISTVNNTPYCLGESICFEATPIFNGSYNILGWSVQNLTTGNTDNYNIYSTTLCVPPINEVGNYIVTIFYSTPCVSFTSSQYSFTVQNPQVTIYSNLTELCVGQNINFSANIQCVSNINTYQWHFSNGLVLNSPSPNVAFNNPGIYSVHLIINGNIISNTLYFTVHPLPDKPIITGINNTCDGLTINYQITNYNAQQTYIWNVNGGTVISQSGANATIQWNSSQGGTINVATTNTNNCQNTSEVLMVHPCCLPANTANTYIWNNTQVSTILPSYLTNNYTDIYINGLLIVDANIYIPNKQVYLGPDAKIYVLPDNSFEVDIFTVVQSGCNYMWDGIYTEHPKALIGVYKQSKLQDAKNAIVSRNGGKFIIDNSTLDKNYKHIVVENYNATHTGSIKQSNLLCTGGNSLIAPHIGKRTFKAIEIKDVYQLQIGSQLFAADKNTIDNADYGIWAERSKVMVYNNDFKNITTVPPPPGTGIVKREPCPKGTAICSYTDANYYFAELHIGGLAQNEANLFINCGKGIVSNFSHQINIIKNNFNNINQTAVEVNDAEWRNIKIDRNNFTAATTGINIWNCVFSPVDIVNNNFDLGNKTNGTAIILRAIYPSGPVQMHSVRNNCIYNYSNGIVTYNTIATTIADNIIRIRHTNQPAVKNGINSSFSVNSKILSNDIRLAGNNNTFTTDPNIGGLYASMSIGMIAVCNRINNTGFAIRCSDKMPSDIVGNTLNGRRFGLWLSDNGYIGDQDHLTVPGWPSYNTWSQSINYQARCWASNSTNGSLSKIIYKTPNPIYSPLPSLVNNIGTDFSIATQAFTGNSPTSYSCGILLNGCNSNSNANNNLINIGGGTPKPKRLSGDIINETPVFYGTNPSEEHIKNKKALYHYLKNDNLTLSPTEQVFVNTTDIEPEGQMRNLALLLYDTLLTSSPVLQAQAQALSASISPQISIEMYVKQVLEIYRQRLSAGVDTFSQNQLQQLEEIAHLCPFTDGYGVYMARAILLDNGTELIYNACEFDLANNRIGFEDALIVEEKIMNDDENYFVSIYPNPNNGEMTLLYELPNSNNAQLLVHNTLGKLIKQYELNNKAQQLNINEPSLENGLYYYTIMVDDEIVKTDKFIIIK
jgi:hypothetical protein